MLKTIAYRILCVLLLLWVIQSSASATAILVVVKPDAVWIAADGTRSGGPSGWFTVCKAHEAYGGVILKYGYVGETSPTTDDVVQKLIRENRVLRGFQKSGQHRSPHIHEFGGIVWRSVSSEQRTGEEGTNIRQNGGLNFRWGVLQDTFLSNESFSNLHGFMSQTYRATKAD